MPAQTSTTGGGSTSGGGSSTSDGGSTATEEEKTWQVGDKTIERTIKKTNSPGYSWDVGLNVWLLKGEVSKSGPSTSWEEKETIKIKCCQPKGPDNLCSYEIY